MDFVEEREFDPGDQLVLQIASTSSSYEPCRGGALVNFKKRPGVGAAAALRRPVTSTKDPRAWSDTAFTRVTAQAARDLAWLGLLLERKNAFLLTNGFAVGRVLKPFDQCLQVAYSPLENFKKLPVACRQAPVSPKQ